MSGFFVTPRIVAWQAPLSVGFPRQEYWNGLPFWQGDYRLFIQLPTQNLLLKSDTNAKLIMSKTNILIVCFYPNMHLYSLIDQASVWVHSSKYIPYPPSTPSPFITLLAFASLVAQRLKRLPGMQETWVRSLGWEDPLEKKMATHSSTLAWRIPRREEPGRLQSMGSQRVGHDWVTLLTYYLLSVQEKYFLIGRVFWCGSH